MSIYYLKKKYLCSKQFSILIEKFNLISMKIILLPIKWVFYIEMKIKNIKKKKNNNYNFVEISWKKSCIVKF